MRHWKSIAITLVLLAIIIRWSGILDEKGSRTPPPAPVVKPVVSDEPPASPPAVEVPVVAETPPLLPAPRSDESRASSRRDFENPLAPSDTPDIPPPRRASDSGAEIGADFDQIYLMLRDYRTLTGENPVGTNAEIMKAIMGDNPKGARLGPPEGQKLNGDGELIDRWGTPYFFHQLTKDMMEIRSAGPDQGMWTRDDIIGE